MPPFWWHLRVLQQSSYIYVSEEDSCVAIVRLIGELWSASAAVVCLTVSRPHVSNSVTRVFMICSVREKKGYPIKNFNDYSLEITFAFDKDCILQQQRTIRKQNDSVYAKGNELYATMLSPWAWTNSQKTLISTSLRLLSLRISNINSNLLVMACKTRLHDMIVIYACSFWCKWLTH